MTTSSTGDFTGKVAFITNVASGIGQATATAFARAAVVVADEWNCNLGVNLTGVFTCMRYKRI